MEIVLQWLDELDDLALSLALRWEMLRRRCLQLGLVTALAGLADAAPPGTEFPLSALTVVAALSVGVWAVALAGALVLKLPRQARPA